MGKMALRYRVCWATSASRGGGPVAARLARVAILGALMLVLVVAGASSAAVTAAPATAPAAPRTAKVGLTAVSFASPRYGWAVGPQATILRTRDGGRHWTRQYAQSKFLVDQTVFTSVQAISSSTCWAVGDGCIYKTTDAGKTWKRRAKRLYPTDLALNSWSDCAFVGKVGWVVSGNGDIIGTRDGGATWTRQRRAQQTDAVAGVWALDGRHAYIVMNAVGGHCVLATTDGSHWADASSRQIWEYWYPDYSGICANSADNIYLSTTTGEVCVSRDGGKTWSVCNPAVGPYQETGGAWLGIGGISCFGNTICAVGVTGPGQGGAILSGDSGWTWGWVGFAPPGGTSPLAMGASDWVSPKTGWIVGASGQIYRTQDRGLTWQRLR